MRIVRTCRPSFVGALDGYTMSALRRVKRLLAWRRDRLSLGVAEPEMMPKSFLRSWLREDPVIVIAGAHAGQDCLELSRTWPAGHVHAFEPVPSLFRRLIHNARRCENVTAYMLALADRCGKGRMHVSSGASDASSSLMMPKEHLRTNPDVLFEEVEEVEVTTLEAWCEAQRVPQVDMLWLDMQGCELAMLQASKRALDTVRAVYTEVFTVELYDGAPLYPEVRTWLENRGFKVEREDLHWEEGGAVLFVRAGAHYAEPASAKL